MEQIEWAVATRFQANRDLLIVPQIQSSLFDPSCSSGFGTKMDIDATAPVGTMEGKFEPIAIPDYEKLSAEGYL